MLTRSLKTFLIVARTRNLTRAAEEVNLAQSSVSDQILALEANFGVALFTRSKQGLDLTPAGRVLQPYVEQLVLLADEARVAVDAVAAGDGGAITIGALETIAATKLPHWLSAFRRSHPPVALRVKVAGSGDLLRQVIDGEIDVAFRFEPPEPDRRLVQRAIATVPLVLIAPPEQGQVLGAEPAALAGARFIVTESGCAYRRLFEAAFGDAGVPLPPTTEVGSVAAIARLVANGEGLALVPRLAVEDALERGEIIAAPWPGRPAVLAMIWRRRRVQPAALTAFLAASAAFEPIRPAGARPPHAALCRS